MSTVGGRRVDPARVEPPGTPDDETLPATTPTGELRELPALAPSALDAGAADGVAKRANQLRVQAA